MFAQLLARRDILSTLVEKDFKSRYKAKALGRLWSIADPLIMVSIYVIVFVHIFKVAEPFFPIFLLLAITPYRFLSNVLNAAASSVMDNVALVKRVTFPRIFLPLAVVFSHLRHFGIELLLVAGLFAIFPEALHVTPNLVWLVPIFAIQMTLLIGLALAVSALNVRYRDTQYIITSGLAVLYWLTPIFYKFMIVPPKLARILMWNPMVGIVEGYRSVLLHGSRPSLQLLGASGLVALLALVAGVTLFRHYDRLFSDYL